MTRAWLLLFLTCDKGIMSVIQLEEEDEVDGARRLLLRQMEGRPRNRTTDRVPVRLCRSIPLGQIVSVIFSRSIPGRLELHHDLLLMVKAFVGLARAVDQPSEKDDHLPGLVSRHL